MKKIVVNGGGTYGGLLTPKWTVEYYRRKGINLYVYEADIDEEYDGLVYILRDSDKLNDNTEIYTCYYLIENIGDVIIDISAINENLIFECYTFDNREDDILLGIANEINDSNLIKIIEIPNEVEYCISQTDCGFSEWVEEKHRIWT